jgi:peptidoglycan biosynthesis protein MviN/MurJ (putative lipid II flippase)
LTNWALLGYVVGLPGAVAGEFFTRGFVALKDTKTPLFVNVLGLAVRYSLIVLLISLFSKNLPTLAIPLAVAGTMTSEALFLCLLLLLRLRTKVKLDKGMQRLQRWRIKDRSSIEKSEMPPETEEAKIENV